MYRSARTDILDRMPLFVLQHVHEAGDCAVAFASWRGFRSTLRGTDVLSSCRQNGHELWFVLDAEDADAALALLPPWIGARSRGTRVERVPIP